MGNKDKKKHYDSDERKDYGSNDNPMTKEEHDAAPKSTSEVVKKSSLRIVGQSSVKLGTLIPFEAAKGIQRALESFISQGKGDEISIVLTYNKKKISGSVMVEEIKE